MQEPEDTQTYANDSATSSPINTGLTQRRSAPVLRAGKVYFIKCRHAIKIGFSLAPAIRIVELQNGSPHDLKLLGWDLRPPQLGTGRTADASLAHQTADEAVGAAPCSV